MKKIKNVCPLVLAATTAKPRFFEACLETWIPYFENYLISGDCSLTDDISHCIATDNTGWHSCPPKLFNGLAGVVKRYPACEWVLAVDDDTFVNHINLIKLLSTLDSSKRAIYGRDMTGNFPFNNKQVQFCSGGAGTLIPLWITKEISQKMITPQWDWLPQCSEWPWKSVGEVPDNGGADVKLGYFATKNEIQQKNLAELFQPEGYGKARSTTAEDILNVVTYHRQGPREQRILADILLHPLKLAKDT